MAAYPRGSCGSPMVRDRSGRSVRLPDIVRRMSRRDGIGGMARSAVGQTSTAASRCVVAPNIRRGAITVDMRGCQERFLVDVACADGSIWRACRSSHSASPAANSGSPSRRSEMIGARRSRWFGRGAAHLNGKVRPRGGPGNPRQQRPGAAQFDLLRTKFRAGEVWNRGLRSWVSHRAFSRGQRSGSTWWSSHARARQPPRLPLPEPGRKVIKFKWR
jgi:hypothetical protein